MEEKGKNYSKELLGKTIVSKSGKKFGEVGDLIFEVGSGELIHIQLKNPTVYMERMELEKTKDGQILIPFSAVMATGDYIVIAEEDII
ncbi:MAG TPA: PRC-barrel domain-containing protein [Candidatus Nanoarchaeia archaeon]|nr:PRC-barrel domain-containing protein [Candidatus Nanoarchaeia archaeon]